MSVHDAPPPTTPDSLSKSRTVWQKCLDWLFGRDFFISYRWDDGRIFALKLVERLRSEQFDCFLDSDGYLKGDNWQRVGDRELRKTSRLVLIGSPEVHKSSAVERELRVFGANQGRIIAVEFGDSLSRERFPESPVLALLDERIIRQKEHEQALASGPSDELIAELKRVFEGETTNVRRLRAVQTTAIILLILLILAAGAALLARAQYRLNVVASALEDSRRAASEMERGNHDLAIGHLVRSLERNPLDASVASALMRIGVEQAVVSGEKLVSGPYSDVQISRDGKVASLLSAEGGRLFLRAGSSSVEVPLDGRLVGRIHLAPDGASAALLAGNEAGRCRIGTDVAPFVEWLAFEAPPTACAAGSQAEVLIGDTFGNLFLWPPGGSPLLLKDGAFEAGAVQEVAWVENSKIPCMLRQDGYWQQGMPEEDWQKAKLDTHGFIPGILSPGGVIWTSSWDKGELEGDGPRSELIAWRYNSPDASWENLARAQALPKSKFKSLSTDDSGRNCLGLFETDEVMLAGFLPERSPILYRPGVAAAALSPDGTVAVTAHMDGLIHRWEGEHLAPMGTGVYAPKGITQLALSADASIALASAPDGVWQFGFPDQRRLNDQGFSPAVRLKRLPDTFRNVSATEKRMVADSGIRVERVEEPGGESLLSGRWRIRRPGHSPEFYHPMTADELKSREGIWCSASVKIGQPGASR